MAIIRGMGSNSQTNRPTCGGNIKGGLAPLVNNSASVMRAIGGPTHGTSGPPPTTTLQGLPAKCTASDIKDNKQFFPTYCCPGGVGSMYRFMGMYNTQPSSQAKSTSTANSVTLPNSNANSNSGNGGPTELGPSQ